MAFVAGRQVSHNLTHNMWEFPERRGEGLKRLRKKSSIVIPKAGFARGIFLFPRMREKANPSLRSG
jgi:hypothetical protein